MNQGAWEVLVCFESFLAADERDFALQVCTTDQCYELVSPPPLGTWLRLTGDKAEKHLRLSFRARELIVMIASVRVGTQRLGYGPLSPAG